MASARNGLKEVDYQRLARFRYALRQFLRFSEDAARDVGISPGQYQLLLFIRSFGGRAPIVAEMAEKLQVRHQSAVGLIDRCERAGLVARRADPDDGRRVRVVLTAKGRRTISRLVSLHLRELAGLRRAVPSVPHLAPRSQGRRA
ncbi:MAG TPA: MarR family transcriptional regulator [Thermoanaerobaculia bacterium]|jgi:DNA-binding MarR family transcriptional regulator